jgi:NAD(P)-dependent dehydrogenase (short-subunit alcohol dehydrogenase family)
MKGKVVITAGAAQGIGRAIAVRFAAEGASLALCDLNAVGLVETLRALPPSQTAHRTYQLDATDSQAVTSIVQGIAQDFGCIDVLVNTVGITRRTPLLAMSPAEWDLVLRTNLTSAFLLTQAVGQHMIARGQGGKIIHIASNSGLMAQADKAHYCTSKAALIHFVRCAALELAPHHIGVNSVSPGPVATDEILHRATKDKDYVRKHNILLGRLARLEDVANAVLFLASSASDHITGHDLVVDAGESVC